MGYKPEEKRHGREWGTKGRLGDMAYHRKHGRGLKTGQSMRERTGDRAD